MSTRLSLEQTISRIELLIFGANQRWRNRSSPTQIEYHYSQIPLSKHTTKQYAKIQKEICNHEILFFLNYAMKYVEFRH